MIPLIKSTRQFIQQKKEKTDLFFVGEDIKKKEILQPPKSTISPLPEKIEIKETPLTPSTRVELSRFDEMKSLLKKVQPQLFREEIPSFALLVTKNAKSLPFLKKVAEFISESFIPAKAVICRDENEIEKSLHGHPFKLILSSASEFYSQKNVEIHKLTKIEDKIYWLPLHSCEHYLNNPTLKRALWNTLKSLPIPDLLQ